MTVYTESEQAKIDAMIDLAKKSIERDRNNAKLNAEKQEYFSRLREFATGLGFDAKRDGFGLAEQIWYWYQHCGYYPEYALAYQWSWDDDFDSTRYEFFFSAEEFSNFIQENDTCFKLVGLRAFIHGRVYRPEITFILAE